MSQFYDLFKDLRELKNDVYTFHSLYHKTIRITLSVTDKNSIEEQVRYSESDGPKFGVKTVNI